MIQIKHSTLRLALLLLLVAVPLRSGFGQNLDVLDEIVAVVGEDIILKSEVDAFVMSILQQQQGMTYSEELWMQALNQMIDDKVLVAHAKRDTLIIVTDDQVEQNLDQRIQQMTAQLGGEDRLEELYDKSIVEIKAELREDLRDQLLAEQFRGKKLRNVKATPSDVENWFSQFPTDSLPTLPDIVRVAHVVRFPEVTNEARAEAREIIQAIRDSIIVGGSTIEEMAQLFSDDPGSAENGGRYQGMQLNEVVPEFAAVAARAPIGQVSQIFETQFGLHILRMNSRLGDQIDYNHVLIAFDADKADPTNAIELLEVLRDSVVTHQVPFEAIARRHSEDDFSKAQGGRVIDPRSGERDLFIEALGPRWQATLATMKESDISEPVETELLDGRKAYHIVLLQKRVPEHRVDITTDYELIEQYALREKQGEILREWLEELKKEVYIEIRGKAQDLSVAQF